MTNVEVYSVKTNKTRWFEIFIITILSLLSFVVALKYMQNYKQPQAIYQNEFAPAVLQACGRGFLNLKTLKSEALKQFLFTKTQQFDCKALPPKLETSKLTPFQASEVYLMKSAALLWKIFGVAWKNLYPLNAFLFMLTIIGIYGVLRLAVHPGIAILGVLPFILLTLLCIGWLIKSPFSPKRAIIIAAITGFVIGIGLGFRVDLLIYMPLFIMAMFFFTSLLRKPIG